MATHLERHNLTRALALDRRKAVVRVVVRVYLPAIPFLIAGALIPLEFHKRRFTRGILLATALTAYVSWWRRLASSASTARSEITMLDAFREDKLRRTTDSVSSHDEAVRIFHDAVENLTPFVLFLRNFDIEAFDRLVPDGLPSDRRPYFATILSGEPKLEDLIVGPLAKTAPVLGVSNPAELLPGRAVIPRIQLPNEGWESTLRDLVRWASLIVMDLEYLTPGVLRELEVIVAEGRQDDTIVMLLPSSQSADIDLQEFVQIATGVPETERAPVRRDSPALESFEQIFESDKVSFDALDQDLAFGPVLARIGFVRALSGEQRRSRQKALRDNAEGFAYSRQRLFEKAFQSYSSALASICALGDREATALVLLNLAEVEIGLERYEDALNSLNQSLSLTEALGSGQLKRKLYRGAANLCFQMRDFRSALEFYAKLNIEYRNHSRSTPAKIVLRAARCCLQLREFGPAESLLEALLHGLSPANEDQLREAHEMLAACSANPQREPGTLK